MNWDLATILVILVFVTGIIWAYDKFLLEPQRPKSGQDDNEDIPGWIDLARSLFPVFLIVLILRSFLVEPFRIPSNSMMPTLLTGDFILVNKYNYGIRLPVINQKIIEISQPERGDVVVFRYPEDPSIPYIKRIVGLPGDMVQYHNETKILYINGEPVSQQTLGIYHGVGGGKDMSGAQLRREQLDEVEHDILVLANRTHRSMRAIDEWQIPKDQYFVLGDNRDNSKDSRYWGTVPDENLIGRAFFIWMNWDWALPNGWVDWSRLGTVIQ
ncbi:MAG: signal peptidase I [Pseudomonadota bacterium]